MHGVTARRVKAPCARQAMPQSQLVTDAAFRAMMAVLRPLELVLRPDVQRVDRIPIERPLMFVGNHQLLALDSIFLISALWRSRQIHLRGLGDDFLFRFQPIRFLVESLGGQPASREACERLMGEGACLLVYPGGAREAAKAQGETFSLDWWDRLGFARMALAYGCTVVPVAATGIDSSLHILMGGAELVPPPLRGLLERLRVREDLLPPLFVPTGAPQLAFRFGPPISMDHFGLRNDETTQRRLRAEVAASIEHELSVLRAPPTRAH